VTDLTLKTQNIPALLDGAMAWIRAHQRRLLLAAAVFQVVFLAGMIASRSVPLLTGRPVLVRVVPVDPRDLFRGDYVTLGYEFSQLPASFSGDMQRASRPGQPIYVSLEQEAGGAHWKPVDYALTPPSAGVYLRGTQRGYGWIDYGLDRWFLQQGTGLAFEEAIRSKRGVSAEIMVAPNGRAALKNLVLD